MAGRGRAFQRNPELQRFVLPDVRPTGKQLGVGSYGSVEELEMNGLVCAGKRLHDALLQRDNVGVQNIERKYLEECQVMPTSRLLFYFLGNTMQAYSTNYRDITDVPNVIWIGNGRVATPTYRAVPRAVLPGRVSTASAGDGATGQQSR